MRNIPAALAVLGLTAVGLTGCALPAGYDTCSRPATDAAATDVVTVSGDAGAKPDVAVRTPFHVDSASFDDLTVGEGPALTAASQAVVLDIAIISGETGEQLVSTPYNGDLSSVNSFERWTEAIPALEDALHCATEGTRTVVALAPGDVAAQTAASIGLGGDDSAVAVVDLPKVYLPHAQGSLVYNDALGLPTVVRAPDGRPGVIVPDAAPPDDLVVQTLIKGTGPKVTGDQPVRLQYTGVTWADRDVFDTTWNSESASLSVDPAVPDFAQQRIPVGGLQAIEGATVGSQLLVVVPPDLGYGDTAQGALPADSTLVYVIDILGTDPAPPE